MNSIKLVCLDFDGVFTDGKIIIDSKNEVIKHYNVKDGKGIEQLRINGIKTAVISGFKENDSTKNICNHLNIDYIRLNCSNKQKVIEVKKICNELNIELNNVAYIGDDINDLDLLRRVGLSACPKDGHYECKNIVKYICDNNGGNSCIREFIDYILLNNNKLLEKNHPLILDCLLRDGGIINDWKFSKDFVNEYLTLMNDLNIYYIEMGYISSTSNDNFLSNIDILRINDIYNINKNMKSKLSVMGDYGKFNLEDIPCNKLKTNPISLIRVAGPLNMLNDIDKYIIDINKKGYEVSINIMNSSYLNEDNIKFIINKVNSLSVKPDYLYIADSFGALFPLEVKNILNKLRLIKDVKIGYHAHNNLQLAFSNVLEAINNKVDIIDTTVCGMGKGSGNLPLELYLLYLISKNNMNYKIHNLFNFIDKYFTYLKQNYSWGYDTKYAITGSLNASSRYAEYLLNKHNKKKLVDIFNLLEDTPVPSKLKYPKPKSNVCCIIPARLGSERLLGKPLIKIDGISVIARTGEQVKKCKNINDIYITTDDDKIIEESKKIDIDYVKITDECNNGTERVYKAYMKINKEYDVIVNVQGDEAFIKPCDIDKAIQYHINNNNYCTCIHSKSKSYKDMYDSSKTKVCLKKNNRIMYISRSIIPGNKKNENYMENFDYYIHLGIYIYSPNALEDINNLTMGNNENIENIEMLRLIENDKDVDSFEVDCPYIQINTLNDINELKSKYDIILYKK